MAKFVSVNCGPKAILVNLDCTIKAGIPGQFSDNFPTCPLVGESPGNPAKHFMDYVSQKHTEMENSVNRKKTIAEQAIARVKASNTILMSVSRRPKGAGVNLEDCILDYDFIDSEGRDPGTAWSADRSF